MNRIGEYKTQSVLAVMQAIVIVYGILTTAAMLKSTGYPDSNRSYPFLVILVRQYGLIFLTIPAIWVWITIQLELRDELFSQRYSLASGLILLAGLWYFFTVIASLAGVTRGSIQEIGQSDKTQNKREQVIPSLSLVLLSSGFDTGAMIFKSDRASFQESPVS